MNVAYSIWRVWSFAIVALPHLYLQHRLVVEAWRSLQTDQLKYKWEGDCQPRSHLPLGLYCTTGIQPTAFCKLQNNCSIDVGVRLKDKNVPCSVFRVSGLKGSGKHECRLLHLKSYISVIWGIFLVFALCFWFFFWNPLCYLGRVISILRKNQVWSFKFYLFREYKEKHFNWRSNH